MLHHSSRSLSSGALFVLTICVSDGVGSAQLWDHYLLNPSPVRHWLSRREFKRAPDLCEFVNRFNKEKLRNDDSREKANERFSDDYVRSVVEAMSKSKASQWSRLGLKWLDFGFSSKIQEALILIKHGDSSWNQKNLFTVQYRCFI